MVNDDGLVQELQTLNLPQPKEEQHDRSYLASKVASKICEHQSMAQSRKDHPMILSPYAIALWIHVAQKALLRVMISLRNTFTE
jgi:hypothetical protein